MHKGTLLTSFVSMLSIQCSNPLNWPESPLYNTPPLQQQWNPPETILEAMSAIEGRYAHYDIVAYEERDGETPFNSFIVSYGFTEFYIENGQLVERDSFCHAEQKNNYKNVETEFSDAATQAILPKEQVVDLFFQDNTWHIYRPATPTLLGIKGDPQQPLSMDPNDPQIFDADGDGKPGVTVRMSFNRIIKGSIYITRREIFNNHLKLHSNGNIYGYVEDYSEQFVVGASHKILERQVNPPQHEDYGLSPIILVPISDSIDSCDELMKHRDLFFPPEPEFVDPNTES